MYKGMLVHKAIVHEANSATGECKVVIPALLGGAPVSVSSTGLTLFNGLWDVPDVGSNVYVLSTPELTQFTWMTSPTSVPEVVRDVVGAALVPGVNVTIDVDDTNDTITISSGVIVGEIKMYGGTATPSKFLPCTGGTVLIADYPEYAAAVGTTWGGNGTTTVGVPDLRGRGPIGAGTGAGLTARTLGTQNIGEETHLLTGAESGTSVHTHTQDAHNHTQNAHNHSASSGTVSADHTHSFSGTTGSENANHQHAAPNENFAEATAAFSTVDVGNGGSIVLHMTYTPNTGSQNANHQHGFSGTTGGISTNHTHSITVNNNTATNQSATATNQNSTAANASSAHNNMQPSAVVNFIIRCQS